MISDEEAKALFISASKAGIAALTKPFLIRVHQANITEAPIEDYKLHKVDELRQLIQGAVRTLVFRFNKSLTWNCSAAMQA